MHVITPPETKTDKRLDELAKAVGSGFARVDEKFDQVDEKFDRVEKDIRELRGEIGGLKKVLLQGAIAIILALIGSHWIPG